MIGHRIPHKLSDRDLAALADGSLPDGRRMQVEQAVADSRELAADLSAQRRVLAALRGVAREPAPGALRARLELARDPRRTGRGAGRLAIALAGGGSAGLATLAAVAVLGGASGVPTVALAATLGSRPAVAPTGTSVPGVSAAGISFPNYSPRFRLEASGVRRDRLDGRMATTVFYEGGSRRIAYTILTGSPIPAGTVTRSTAWNGILLRSFDDSGRAVVTWQQNGHTCVLSGAGLTLLTRLAVSEQGGGQPY